MQQIFCPKRIHITRPTRSTQTYTQLAEPMTIQLQKVYSECLLAVLHGCGDQYAQTRVMLDLLQLNTSSDHLFLGSWLEAPLHPASVPESPLQSQFGKPGEGLTTVNLTDCFICHTLHAPTRED